MKVTGARPFLKWAGGKSTLVYELDRRLGSEPENRFRRYIEPFVGAGAFFFHLRRRYPRLPCRLSDNNGALIETYLVIRDRVEELIARLAWHREQHSPEHYYKVRGTAPEDPVERAARFIYLNRTCYNGLYRVNRSGRFNVPMGRYRNPQILAAENLRAVSHSLEETELSATDFEKALSDGGKGDLVYLDPPYHPLSATSQFTAYTSGGFGVVDQKRLAGAFERLSRRGAHVMLSNSDTELVRSLYENLRPRPELIRVQAPRAINSSAKGRGAIAELLICSAVEPEASRSSARPTGRERSRFRGAMSERER